MEILLQVMWEQACMVGRRARAVFSTRYRCVSFFFSGR